ncbi:unnamed protein product [Kuraishia capsulata CBS 1993]|uniref:Uncharacterized protein n=1 Tax=Kuraishia capsulata CBS 1993 TaxID=1382522 RepID=W6MPN4_9ASCO|nr:uncharacterized protein KUCA_T00004575001 [Kuraishia capsulata CBS 1993]CDK28591.1 unnamed protein product [Kuraishia capsulata CBS 1993]
MVIDDKENQGLATIYLDRSACSTPLRPKDENVSEPQTPLSRKPVSSGSSRHQQLQQAQVVKKKSISGFAVTTPERRKRSGSVSVSPNRLERQCADLILENARLTREKEKIELELLANEKEALLKQQRINELIKENKTLVNDLVSEREFNEKEFVNWHASKQTYERKIQRLTSLVHSNEERVKDKEEVVDSAQPHRRSYEHHSQFIEGEQQSTERLSKRIKGLEREIELEKSSKMLIIDEFEMFKLQLQDFEEKYNSLKEDYDKLAKEEEGSQSHHGWDESDDEAHSPHDFRQYQSDSQNFTSLAEELNSLPSADSTIPRSTSASSKNSTSNRLSSFGQMLHGIELQNQAHIHKQELMKITFELKSLQLQNEKLHSYIGFLLQSHPQNGEVFKENIEYSDAINIASARKTLKKVIRCASALPVRPLNFDATPLQHRKSDAAIILERFRQDTASDGSSFGGDEADEWEGTPASSPMKFNISLESLEEILEEDPQLHYELPQSWLSSENSVIIHESSRTIKRYELNPRELLRGLITFGMKSRTKYKELDLDVD